MRRFPARLAAALIASLVPATALPHAFLDHAVPPVGGTVATAPREIRIFFSEAVEPAFSAVTLAITNGKPVAVGKAAVDPGDPRQLVLPVPPLGPGDYEVNWHVVSVDAHRTEGHYGFTVRP